MIGTLEGEMRESAPPQTGESLLELQELVVDYVTPERRVRAVVPEVTSVQAI